MAKKLLRKVSRKPVYLILGFSVLLSLGYVVLRPNLTLNQKTEIMQIKPVVLPLGDATLSGGLHQDASGNFVLVLPDRQVIILDLKGKGVDHLINSPVTVTGILSPDKTMQVTKITVQNL